MKNKELEKALLKLYPADLPGAVEGLLALYKDRIKPGGPFAPDETTSMVITYPDMIRKQGERPLKTLRDFFASRLKNRVSCVHILPFFPYSSDDGFSVIDYWNVDPEHGDWRDIESFAPDFDLALDAVINHVSSESEWFRRALRGETPFKDYFIEVDPETDLSGVERPRNLPLLSPFKTISNQKKFFWTTFSDDQLDLDYSCPELFLEILDVLLNYICHGASLIRLDAIAYLWEKPGTSCIHLKETHLLVRILRMILDEIAPHVGILTETNVPHEENISYFGHDGREANMVYQFTLPPLTVHSLLSGNADTLGKWTRSLHGAAPENCTFLNFLASHDGIGVRPLQGMLEQEEIDRIISAVRERGGFVSTKSNPDGTESPYELNINLLSLLDDGNRETAIRRFLCAHSILLSMPGVPAIYFHSMVGSQNCTGCVSETGRPRSINREKLQQQKLIAELDAPESARHTVFKELALMLERRRDQREFHPQSGFEVLNLHPAVFALRRGNPGILTLHNVSHETVSIKSPGPGNTAFTDIISNTQFPAFPEKLAPCQYLWLKQS